MPRQRPVKPYIQWIVFFERILNGRIFVIARITLEIIDDSGK
jgi:hypothetical protein